MLLKPAVFALAITPFLRLVVLAFTNGLGANPIEAITRSTGFWTLVLLCVTLTVTPLRRLSGWSRLARLRRMLGLFCFFYASLHLMTWVWFDQWFDPAGMLADVVKRPFITAGFIAFVLLVPLALTSNAFMIRRLGRRWQQLHRLVFPIAIIAVLHFWWHKVGKNDLFEPTVFALIVALLLGFRLWIRWLGRDSTSRR